MQKRKIMPLPRAMRATAPTLEGYERGEWWAKRKAEYLEKATAFYAAHPNITQTHEPDEPLMADNDLDDSIPF